LNFYHIKYLQESKITNNFKCPCHRLIFTLTAAQQGLLSLKHLKNVHGKRLMCTHSVSRSSRLHSNLIKEASMSWMHLAKLLLPPVPLLVALVYTVAFVVKDLVRR
jgi:hypothetical protein